MKFYLTPITLTLGLHKCHIFMAVSHEPYKIIIQFLFNMARKSDVSFHLTAFAFTMDDLERSYHGAHIFN